MLRLRLVEQIRSRGLLGFRLLRLFEFFDELGEIFRDVLRPDMVGLGTYGHLCKTRQKRDEPLRVLTLQIFPTVGWRPLAGKLIDQVVLRDF